MVIQGATLIPNNISNVVIAILKGATNEAAPISGMMPSRPVRMSPRLAKKRNSQLRILSGFPSATTYRKENSTTGGHITNNQQAYLPSSRGSRGRCSVTSSVGVASARRTSRRSSSKCNHSSTEVCNHCIQR